MKALLITVGSRGDAEPFCALAQSLNNAGHDVDLWLQTDYQYLMKDFDTVYELPFTSTDFYKFVGDSKHDVYNETPRVRFTSVVADIIGQLVLPCWKSILTTTVENDKPDVIVVSSLARHLGMALSAKLDTKLALIQLQPLIPTGDFPHYSNEQDCVNAILNGASKDENLLHLESYWKLERFQYDFVQESWQDVYKEMNMQDAFPTYEYMRDMLQGKNSNIALVNAFASQVIPTCSDHVDLKQVWNVGALADDYLPKDWNAPKELVEFLDNGTKPICVGYGSMPFEKVQLVKDAIEQAHERAILVGSAMKGVETSDCIFVVESAPYSYLLPRCSVMLSHGGAGVVHATLRAGIPSVISGLFGDQFFWAILLERMKLGVKASSLPEMTVKDIVECIQKAKSCTETCGALGEAIVAQGSGVQKLVQLLAQWTV